MKLVYGTESELAMGSPMMASRLELQGSPWQPAILNGYDFVSGAGEISPDGLVFFGKWTQVRPAALFRVYLLDTVNRSIYQSEQLEDGLKSLEILGPRQVRIWLHRVWDTVVAKELAVTESAPKELY